MSLEIKSLKEQTKERFETALNICRILLEGRKLLSGGKLLVGSTKDSNRYCIYFCDVKNSVEAMLGKILIDVYDQTFNGRFYQYIDKDICCIEMRSQVLKDAIDKMAFSLATVMIPE
jgi:hypothetical protein